jgi:hypothetical protein
MGRLEEARAIVARLRAITPRNRSERSTLSEHRALRAVPVGFALGGRRDGNKPEQRVSHPGLEIITKLATVLEVEPAEFFQSAEGRT